MKTSYWQRHLESYTYDYFQTLMIIPFDYCNTNNETFDGMANSDYTIILSVKP